MRSPSASSGSTGTQTLAVADALSTQSLLSVHEFPTTGIHGEITQPVNNNIAMRGTSLFFTVVTHGRDGAIPDGAEATDTQRQRQPAERREDAVVQHRGVLVIVGGLHELSTGGLVR